MNPMAMMMGVTLLIMVVMPKMMANMDPEQLKEMQSMQARRQLAADWCTFASEWRHVIHHPTHHRVAYHPRSRTAGPCRRTPRCPPLVAQGGFADMLNPEKLKEKQQAQLKRVRDTPK